MRKKNPDGFFRFNVIDLEYDMKSLMNLSDFVQISYPFEISLAFSGKFLKNMQSTSSLKVDKVKKKLLILFLILKKQLNSMKKPIV